MCSALFVILLVAAFQACAWSGPVHQAIADVAWARLSPLARAALAHILQGTADLTPGVLTGVPTWLDDVRAGQAYGTIAAGWSDADIQEADRFKSRQGVCAGQRGPSVAAVNRRPACSTPGESRWQ